MDLDQPAAATTEDNLVKENTTYAALSPEKYKHKAIINPKDPENKDPDLVLTPETVSEKGNNDCSGEGVLKLPSPDTNVCEDVSLEEVPSLSVEQESQERLHINEEAKANEQRAEKAGPQKSHKKLSKCK